MLPAYVKLEGILRVKINSKSARERVVRKERFASITPFLDEYVIEEREEMAPYLCIVRYRFNRSAREVLESLQGIPFQAATIGRLFDLCRAHPKKQFGYRIAFLGSSWYIGSNIRMTGYPCLRETPEGARILASTLDCNRFPTDWRFALQPSSIDVVEGLLQRIEEGRFHMRAARTTAIA